jgi:hypothetical protein
MPRGSWKTGKAGPSARSKSNCEITKIETRKGSGSADSLRRSGGGRAAAPFGESSLFRGTGVRMPDEPVAQLFGVAIPSHPTLVSVAFYLCKIAPRHLTHFTALVPMELRFVSGAVDGDLAQAIANVLLRNVPLSALEVNPYEFGGGGPFRAALEVGSCQVICHAAAKTLRVLNINAKEVHEDTLGDAAAASSPLTELSVSGSFTFESVATIARQLRTNTTLTGLELLSGADPDPTFWPLAKMLDTYNFTLVWVSLARGRAGSDMVRTISDLLRRNRRIRTTILEHLPSRGYCMAPAGLWPTALGRISSFPTLLYRFLRAGSVDSVNDRLVRHIAGPGMARRVRSRGSEPRTIRPAARNRRKRGRGVQQAPRGNRGPGAP